ncbi:MAG: hydrogenase maturation protease [Candidatus Krumholzibacteriota bacterium]|nr:hydrogenase maturation protease [Candidatus Krumholzibacteriota bacterium]
MKTIILGLGNTVLGDDGVGVYVARLLRGCMDETVAVREAELAGLDLMEMLNGYDRAVIIDAILLEGEDPGTVFRLRPDDMKISPRLASCHDIDLVTALALGKRLRFHMPREVVVYAVQGEDVLTLREGCLPAVERVMAPLAEEIAGFLRGVPCERISIDLAERKSGSA